MNNIKYGRDVHIADGTRIFLNSLFINDCIIILERLIEQPLRNRVKLFNLWGPEIVNLSNIVSKLEKIMKMKTNTKSTREKAKYFVGDNGRINSLFEDMKYTSLNKDLKLTYGAHGYIW